MKKSTIKADLIESWNSANKDNKEWLNLATYGLQLNIDGIDYKANGYPKLKDFIESSNIFELKKDESKTIPVFYIRLKKNTDAPTPKYNTPNNALTNWAFLGYYPKMIESLKDLALEEDWSFNTSGTDAYPILSNYLKYTFFKLQNEKEKILQSDDHEYAVFNTGLVDRRYLPIYALFKKNNDRTRPQPWYLVEFCIEGENRSGKTLVDKFAHMPKAAHYFNEVSDMLYDTKIQAPSLDIEHILIERINRFPYEFIERNAPRDFEVKHTESMTIEEKNIYYDSLRNAIKHDMATYRAMSSRLEDALTLALKRVQWNYKSAIPMYYPRKDSMCLLLPLCLICDNNVDAALVVSKTNSGRYQGETIYSLDWAYKCARLVCRPDSDWLTASKIKETEID